MFFGQPFMILKRTIVARILFLILLVPVVLIFVSFGVGALSEEPLDRTAGFISLAVALGAAVFLVWFFYIETTREIRLYEEGIEQVKGSRKTAIRWQDVKEVWFRAIRVQGGGLVGYAISAAAEAAKKNKTVLDEKTSHINVKIVGPSQTIKIDSNYRGAFYAHEEILLRVNPPMVEECLRKVKGDSSVKFGKVTVNFRGILIGRKALIPFSEVEKIFIQMGRLYLKRRGKRLKVGNIPIHKIPNVFVFLELCDRLAGGISDIDPTRRRNLAATEPLF